MRAGPVAAYAALRGLALGDAFGETWFFRPLAEMDWLLAERAVPAGPWSWTDDTAMAACLYQLLVDSGEVLQDDLALRFAEEYDTDPDRGYGPSMHHVLRSILDGEHWTTVTRSQFGGQGSWGNGAAMRVAPLGAFFADDLDQVVEQAHRSAVVTHAHPEAAAGAIAVALAAALATTGTPPDQLLPKVADRTPASEVASRLRQVARRAFADDPRWVAAEVGAGALISAPDTVPFALWCAARHLDDLTEALWTTASAGGDVDTTCAIVGAIIASRTGLDSVPDEWLTACEPLPDRVPPPPT